MKIFQLIRFKNLLFIVLIQYLTRYALVKPLAEALQYDLVTGNLYFWLIVAATVFIAAGGYIINDYFDTRIDEINKPEAVIIGKSISRRKAMLLHQILTGAGVFIGLLLSWVAKSYISAVIFLFIPGLLWFYSSVYKRQFLVGNIIVALCAGLVPMTIVLFEVFFMRNKFGTEIIENGVTYLILFWGAVFSAFAFITTLIREIVKDMEDEEGDREMECNTLPIVAGPMLTKIIVVVLSLTTVITILAGYFRYTSAINNNFTLLYLFLGIIFPFLYFIMNLIKARTPYEYHQAANIVKFVMFAGTMFLIPVYMLVAKEFGIPFFNLFIQ